MREFFDGWRRKAGCVSLVMACALMLAWARSTVVADAMTLGFLSQTHVVLSDGGNVLWWNRGREPLMPYWDSGMVRGKTMKDNYELKTGHLLPVNYAWSVPFWAIVWPLTLLSAYLILWKPRKRV